MASQPAVTPVTPYCSIERALAAIGDRWSFLVMREILLYGESRFGDLRERLGIASNVLSDRLGRLVEAGILEKRQYQDAGSRTRDSYSPTRAGRDLALVLAALQQWGDEHEPRDAGPTVRRRRLSDGSNASVAFVSDSGGPLDIDEVGFERTDAYPSERREYPPFT